MAVLRVCLAVALILLGGGFGARAEDGPATPNGLYDRPVLVIDPGMHTGMITRAAADRDGRWAVTGSSDKTIRVWSLSDGSLARTIRVPAGPGNVGKVHAVAINPDGTQIAAGGWTRWTDTDRQEQIYLFDRESGALKQRIEGLPDVVEHLAFSPDGASLAAVLFDGQGLRVYTRETGWAEVARDETYRDHSLDATFASDGTLVTTAWDGNVRLYTGALRGPIRPARAILAPGGEHPAGSRSAPTGRDWPSATTTQLGSICWMRAPWHPFNDRSSTASTVVV